MNRMLFQEIYTPGMRVRNRIRKICYKTRLFGAYLFIEQAKQISNFEVSKKDKYFIYEINIFTTNYRFLYLVIFYFIHLNLTCVYVCLNRRISFHKHLLKNLCYYLLRRLSHLMSSIAHLD